MKYAYVCVAGTFDGLHAGHEALLKRAFGVGKRVLIGLTSEAYISQYKPERTVASYEARRIALERWVAKRGYASRVTIVPINDPFEPAVSDAVLDAMVVSEQTRKRGDEVNRMRVRNGYMPLILSVVPMVRAQDDKPISTTRVKTGVIDRFGRLTMPDSLRNDLALPLGVVLTGAKVEEIIHTRNRGPVISVGDQTTKTLLDAGLTPSLMIIDNKVNREEFHDLKPVMKKRGFDTRRVTSGPGFISSEALHEIQRALQDVNRAPLVLEVEGEEDLLALPAIIEAPIGAVVYYGQPPVPVWARFDSAKRACGPGLSGIVEVVVTSEKKVEAEILLAQFTH